MHAQYFALINLSLKLQICAKAHFSLLLILLAAPPRPQRNSGPGLSRRDAEGRFTLDKLLSEKFAEKLWITTRIKSLQVHFRKKIVEKEIQNAITVHCHHHPHFRATTLTN